jgi:hypothetical protein
MQRRRMGALGKMYREVHGQADGEQGHELAEPTTGEGMRSWWTGAGRWERSRSGSSENHASTYLDDSSGSANCRRRQAQNKKEHSPTPEMQQLEQTQCYKPLSLEAWRPFGSLGAGCEGQRGGAGKGRKKIGGQQRLVLARNEKKKMLGRVGWRQAAGGHGSLGPLPGAPTPALDPQWKPESMEALPSGIDRFHREGPSLSGRRAWGLCRPIFHPLKPEYLDVWCLLTFKSAYAVGT